MSESNDISRSLEIAEGFFHEITVISASSKLKLFSSDNAVELVNLSQLGSGRIGE